MSEPMTEKQAKYLRDLCHRAGIPFDATLSKQDALYRINELVKGDRATPEDVRAVACPFCGADAGQPCVRERHHQARVDIATPKGAA